MPVLRGAVTFSRFLVEPAEGAPADLKRSLSRALKARAFAPIERRSEEERAAGFVELENHDASEFNAGSLFYGEYALFAWRIDAIKIPSPVLRAELDKWSAAFEKEKGRAPSRGEKAESKGSIRQMLRNRAVPITKVHDVSWNLKSQQLQIWAASRKAVEEVLNGIEAAFKVKLTPLIPATAAARMGIEESALGPTAELIGVELAAELPVEVRHGEA
ncbi:recombination-associated protein RdgC [Hyalangium versicolor]|uniref:recombination-associated protein RdgC n=1 Tax=Hyalangium versicolor TaxID=2861190 RepID=UPI001CCE0B14|nr:recombination-associated protein RdgC [Hyalangium versicolor]